MKISVLQEKLEKAIKIGSKQVALHEGVLCINRCFGINGLLMQPDPTKTVICSDNKLYGMPINKLISMLENTKKTYGDMDIYGNLAINPEFMEKPREIKTVCTIPHNEKDEPIMLTLISLTDLTNEANKD